MESLLPSLGRVTVLIAGCDNGFDTPYREFRLRDTYARVSSAL